MVREDHVLIRFAVIYPQWFHAADEYDVSNVDVFVVGVDNVGCFVLSHGRTGDEDLSHSPRR